MDRASLSRMDSLTQGWRREANERRLVDYFLVAGYDHGQSVEGGTGGGNFPCQGKILQRFPVQEWKECPYPGGLEHFCQPQGWTLSSEKLEPKFFISVLTDIHCRRQHCAVLAFSEAVSKEDLEATKRVQGATADEEDEDEVDTAPSFVSLRSRHSRSTSLPRHMVPGVSLPAMTHDSLLFAPKCLVLTSRYDYPELFRNLLGVIYTAYSECLVGVGGERIRLETLVGNLIGAVYVPPPGGPQVRFSLGATDKLTLQPTMYQSVPASGVKVAMLFKQLGIRNVLTLFSATLTELKILFYSQSFNRLTDACTALTALIYPFKYSHVLIPVLPSSLLEILSTPTPFIIGVNSIHERDICDLLDVVKVDLDGGAITIPENMTIFPLPQPWLGRTLHELGTVLSPELAQADDAFVNAASVSSNRKPLVSLDKELRAVLLRLMAQLLEGHRSCLTLVRIHPNPYISFHKAAFLGLRDVCESAFMKRLLECMFFNTFINDRGPPWRQCDIFDDLYSNFGELAVLEKEDPSKTLVHIKVLAEELFRNENPLTTLNQPFSQKVPQPAEGAMTRVHQPVFPILDEEAIDGLIQKGMDKYLSELASSPTMVLTERLVPMGQLVSGNGTHTLVPNSARRLGVLRNCITSIFENKISEAKKTFPAVVSALKTKQARLALCEELAVHKTGNQVLLDHQQFGMVVRLMNAALQDDSDMDVHGIAAALLPLSATFGRKLSHGVVQYAYTLIQDHAVWHNQQFWESAFFNDVQKEIKNLYLHVEDQNSNSIGEGGSSQANLAQSSTGSGQSEFRLEKHVGSRAREVRRSALVQPAEKSVLELAAFQLKTMEELEENARSVRIQREEQAVFTIACGYIDSLIYLSCPLDAAGSSREGRRMRDEYENASNSVSNSMAESDSIDAESGFEDQEISDSGQSVIKSVQRFIDKVCSESNLPEGHMRSLNHLIPNNVAMHFEQLEAVANQAKRLPPIQKPKINTPSLLPGEDLIIDQGLRVYLLSDGRQDTTVSALKFLPAEGALFLTSYRVIFRGSPIDPFAAEHSITRFFPVTTLSREKRFTINEYLSEIEQQLKEGIQFRSTTFQMIRVAFDEEVAPEDVENFRRALARVQYPENIFHFFAFRGIANLIEGSRQKEKNAKYHTIRGFASKTLKNVTKVTGYQAKKRKTSKFLMPNMMPTQGRLSLPEINQDGVRGIREEDESSEFGDNPPHRIPHHHNLGTATSLKPLDKLNERSYFKDWIRIGLISADYNLLTNPKVHHHTESFRVSTVNNRYQIIQSYPALLLVPAKISDDSLRRYARCHKQGRLPVITWKHPTHHSLLLRGGGYYARGVMGMIRRHHDGPSSSQAENGHYDAELYIQAVVLATPRAVLRPNSAWNMSGSELSLNSLISGTPSSDYPAVHSYPTLTPSMSRKYNPLTKAMGAMSNTLTRGTAPPKFGRASVTSLKGPQHHHGSQSSLAISGGLGGGGSRLSQRYDGDMGNVFQHASLYIFMDKNQVKGSKLEAQHKAEFIPVEYPDTRRVRASFKKLMRACVPSAVSNQPEQSFLKQMEDSEWLVILQTLMQISGAVVDLLDIQGASVMVCLEDGWDVTSQIMSVAKMCLDPYYRTIEGFRVLVEQEWLAHGHRFNHRSQLSNPNQDSGFMPIFLQFLDIVQQIHRQFPLSFEFNDFYIRFLAYHYVSCRFRTFLLDNEFQRQHVGLLAHEDKGGSIPRPSYRNGGMDSHSSDDELSSFQSKANGSVLSAFPMGNHGVNVFDYIDMQASKSCLFQNFMYSRELSSDVLRPFSHVSDLVIWDYYVREELRHGPPYDLELYDRDIQRENEYNCSDSIASSAVGGREPVVAGYDCLQKVEVDALSHALNEIQALESQMGNLNNRWKFHWDNLEVPPPITSRQRSLIPLLEATPTVAAKHHGRNMHKRSTMELILRSIGANTSSTSTPSEAANHAQTHRFEKHNFATPTYCEVCNSLLWGPVRTGLRCPDCGFSCHDKCRDTIPSSCNKCKFVQRDSHKEDSEHPVRDSHPHATPRGVLPTEPSLDYEYGRHSVPDEGSQIICQGYLHKQANFRIKGWKQRWFVLDSTKHQLRYFDTREDFDCREKIDLSEITRITESSSQPGGPKKDDSLYFDLHTVKRTYCFCADTRQATQEWIHKIQSCLST